MLVLCQVAGLWIMLAVAVGVGIALVILHILHVRYARHHLKKGVEVAGQSARRLVGKAAVLGTSFRQASRRQQAALAPEHLAARQVSAPAVLTT